jgi:hypothetical protein
MEGVILCTEQGYDERVLEDLVKQEEYKTDFKNAYVDLISKIVEELLLEGKVNKLQTFGYQIERQGGGPPIGGGMSGFNAINMPAMLQ